MGVQKKEVEELIYLGKLDKNKLGKYSDKLVTYDIILTAERMTHIHDKHLKDFNKIMKNICKVISEPNEILEDSKNENTIFMIGKLEKNNLNVIIKLNTIYDDKHPLNSVMTAWIIRDKNLKKIRERNGSIYRKE